MAGTWLVFAHFFAAKTGLRQRTRPSADIFCQLLSIWNFESEVYSRGRATNGNRRFNILLQYFEICKPNNIFPGLCTEDKCV
jgi:hypothetical protein